MSNPNPQQIQKTNKANLLGVTNLELLFPASIEVTRERLSSAFTQEVTVSKGWLSPTFKYLGRLDGDQLEIQITSSGRSAMIHLLEGDLCPDPNGTRIKITIRNKYPFGIIFPILLGYVICIVSGVFTGVQGVTLVIVVLLLGSILAAVFGGITYAMASWHRSVAAENVADWLASILSDRSLN